MFDLEHSPSKHWGEREEQRAFGQEEEYFKGKAREGAHIADE